MSGPHLLGGSRPADELLKRVVEGLEPGQRIKVYEEQAQRWEAIFPNIGKQLRDAAERTRNEQR